MRLAMPRSRAEKLLSKLPSPPFRLPVIGHLHLVGPLPHRSLRDLARWHGPDVMLLRLGTVPTLVVSSPRAAKAVLRTHDHVFASRPRSAVADVLFYGSTDVAFAPYGEYWRQTRKVVTTHLLTPRKVRCSRAAREQEVRLALARVRDAAAARTAVDLSELFSFFANDVVCQAVTGRLPREQGRNKLFRDLLETNAKLLGGFNLDDYFPSLAGLNVVSAKAVKHRKRWDNLLDSLIDKHVRKTETDEHEDFIDVLLSVQQEYSLTRDNIKAILMDMFEAGTDPTYMALDFAMAELIRNPKAMAKLQAEVRRCAGKGKEIVTEEDLSSMSYLKAVMKESMRLHAPGPLLIPHFSMAECDVEGYTIPSGTRVILNVWALGRNPTCWESADEFMPERFMEEAMDAASDLQGNDFRLLPFGSGRRMCPAIKFTTATFETILANLIYHFNWELPPGTTGIDMTESYGIDVHRKEKLLVVPCVAQDV
ncbi:indole-2-monooxygenase-like [Panicum hallii]|nr:indole-2-monooxygenase-like [Panicum hallii]